MWEFVGLARPWVKEGIECSELLVDWWRGFFVGWDGHEFGRFFDEESFFEAGETALPLEFEWREDALKVGKDFLWGFEGEVDVEVLDFGVFFELFEAGADEFLVQSLRILQLGDTLVVDFVAKREQCHLDMFFGKGSQVFQIIINLILQFPQTDNDIEQVVLERQKVFWFI